MTIEQPTPAPPRSAPHKAEQAAPSTSPVGIPRIGMAAAAVPVKPAHPINSATLVDSPRTRVRRTEDLVELIVTSIGIVSLMILAIYGHQTTTGVTQDVQNALAVVLRRVLLFPLQALEGLTTFILPVAVIVDRLVRKSWRSALQAGLASVIAYAVTGGLIWLIERWGPIPLIIGLTPSAAWHTTVGFSTVYASLSGILTGAGERRASPLIRTGWAFAWIVIGLAVLRGALTLPGALISILIGRAVGLAIRYIFGADDDRAAGLALIRGLRRAGIDVDRVVRMDSTTSIQAWTVRTTVPVGYTEQVRETPAPPTINLDDKVDEDALIEQSLKAQEENKDLPIVNSPGDLLDDLPEIEPDESLGCQELLKAAHSSALISGHESAHRLYAVWDTSGTRRDVTVLDADSQVAGFLSTMWDTIRMKGLSPSRDITVRAAAEHTALLILAARRAGVRTPGLNGMAEAGDSMLLVHDHISQPVAFADCGDRLTDDVLHDAWEQLRRAHAAGLAHRSIESSTVILDGANRVWLLDWGQGEIVSSELSRRMDLAQMMALLASLVGVEKALSSASEILDHDQLASIAPMLQSVVLPRSTRLAMGKRGKVLQDLRDALVDLVPTAHAEPVQLSRFSIRTVIMVIVGVVALWTVLGKMNFEEISHAIAGANMWWLAGALFFSIATYVGAALALVAFCPIKLPLWKSTEVHLASSVVSLVAPAGVGGAAINLRFLNRKGVPTAVGVATVALVQVVQFVVTVIFLVILAATTGQSSGLSLPSGWVLAGAGVLVVIVAISLAVPQIRTFIWKKIGPTFHQIWPRLVWVLSNPRRLALGVLGTFILSVSYILSFAASLWAFGYDLPMSVLAITYLASNTVGSVVPSPGGLGPVELALTGGLVTAGIPSGVALSTTLAYRLVTFWIPIPVGWLSLRRLQHTGDL
ncbi:lysylphosphatidylglycerol synthase transmembrane domain-containing protein [Actinomyces vulturis]|uniref:lysylphosphatidylglycerol synthase transmembrane domain-containing protein n=1 Tax=Actinomyces vulturis TaxID=1857645 RepID=UPI0008334E29|nr:lysylphosphatidylglycerol synthase transmembrane domain-containing protein [Actinomyces vulturis]